MTGRCVLIVDDDPEIAELLAAVLEVYGFVSRTVYNGHDGVAAALELLPDAVILDLMLPDLDGIEVCERIRNGNATKRPSILILTACLTDQHKDRALAAGVDRYLNKPFDPEGIVRELLETLCAINPQ